MDRPRLLGLCATLNVAQAMLDADGLREAGRRLNTAVVSLHRSAQWTEEELERMTEVQAYIIETLADRRGLHVR